MAAAADFNFSVNDNSVKYRPISRNFSAYIPVMYVNSELCKPAVNIEIQDGDSRHSENRQKAISQAPIDGFSCY
jgi:hypothetical protein